MPVRKAPAQAAGFVEDIVRRSSPRLGNDRQRLCPLSQIMLTIAQMRERHSGRFIASALLE